MSSTQIPQCPFPEVRRVVTGHNDSGKSIVIEDNVIAPRYLIPNSEAGSRFYDLFLTDKFPISNSGEFVDKVKGKPAEVVSKGGSTFKIVDMPPGTVTVRLRAFSNLRNV